MQSLGNREHSPAVAGFGIVFPLPRPGMWAKEEKDGVLALCVKFGESLELLPPDFGTNSLTSGLRP